MPINIDVIAIALMESLGIIFLLLAFVFWRQSRRVGGKIESLKDALKKVKTVGRRPEGPCYSFKWVMDQAHKKLIAARASLMIIATLFPFVVTPIIFLIFYNVGYAMLIPLIGLAIFLDKEAFEAYDYSKAILKVVIDKLDKKDQDYMEIAREALTMAIIRFIMVGVTFMIVGPFIPHIFNSLCYGLALYANILFQAAEMPGNIFFGIVIAQVLSGILLLVLPVVAARTLHRKMKELTQRMLKRVPNKNQRTN